VSCEPLSLRRRTFIQPTLILFVEEWGIRKTKKFIAKVLDDADSAWHISKVRRMIGTNRHIIYLTPKEGAAHKSLMDAIETIAALQEAYARKFADVNARERPSPVVASFLLGFYELLPEYPFRLNTFLPHWDFPYLSAVHKNRVSESKQAKAMSSKTGFLRVGNYMLPVHWWRKSDAKVAQALEATAHRHNIPPHALTGNVDEAAAVAALLKENKDWKVARNVIVTVPSPRKDRAARNMGPTITELDLLAVERNGKNLHIGEVKGVGPETKWQWDRIVVRKAITLTPALELFLQKMGVHAHRLRPHFIVVSNREHTSTELANRALITLKPSQPDRRSVFQRLEAHAVWPSLNTLLIRSFREPLW